jgi:hypothetical protein
MFLWMYIFISLGNLDWSYWVMWCVSFQKINFKGGKIDFGS